MSNKQSSIDYVISQLQKSKDWHRVLNEVSQMSSVQVDIISEAKAMHKDEMIDFAMKFMMQDRPIISFYNATYGGNK
jgi:transcriptional regulator of heat shock response